MKSFITNSPRYRYHIIKFVSLLAHKLIDLVGDEAQAVVNLTMRMKSKVRIPQREELLFRAKGFWLAEAKPMDHELR